MVHAGDECRAIGRTNWSGDKCFGEHRSGLGEFIDVWRFYERLSVTGEVGRHIVDNDPEDVGSRGACRGGGEPGGQDRDEERDCANGDELREHGGVLERKWVEGKVLLRLSVDWFRG